MATTYTLPALSYAYDALEPAISGQIMTLHHSKHHATYVANLNAALAAQGNAIKQNDVHAQIALQSAIRFNGGGHINHTLFWQNLAPATSAQTSPDSAEKLVATISSIWGGIEAFQARVKEAALGIQGSGWVWLVKVEDDVKTRLQIVTTKDQNPITGKGEVPIIGIDMWEHAYYLQYLNGKAAYLDNIWKVINWGVAESRFVGTVDDVFKDLKAAI